MSAPRDLPPSMKASPAQVNAMLAHDMRTPLQAISLSAELLLRSEALSERGRRSAVRIVENADWLRRLVDTMLDLARVQTRGTLPLERSELDLAQLVRSSVECAAAAYPDRSFELVDCDPCPGRFDRDRLLQLLSNLLTNAARHGETRAPVRVRLKADGKWATIEVANDNPGGAPLPEYVRAALFRPFLRSAEIADGSPGVGLGTFIVSEVARGHGGTVSVESLPSQTVFRVVLPLA